MKLRKASVLVVGAGMAGLSAAHALHKDGFEVRVLEAGARIGGRTSTDFVDDSLLDRGAQFLSDGYVNVCRLIDELNLRDEFRPTSPSTAIISGGKGRAVSASRPWSVNTSGLLSMSEALTLANGSRQMFKETSALPLEDYSRWHIFDDGRADAWLRSQFNEQILEYIFEPVLQAFYFQEPEELSRALAMLLWNFGGRGKQPRALLGGMEDLVDALAAPLDIRLRSAVQGVDVSADQVAVRIGEESMAADYLILAVPAPAAHALYAPADEIERRLLLTPYAPAVVLAMLIPDGLPKSPLPSDVHAVMFPRRERRIIGSVIPVTRKCPIHVDRGELLNVLLSGEASQRLFDATQDAILAEVVAELESYYPGVRGRIEGVRVYRWREGSAGTGVGRCSDVHAYRSGGKGRRLLLAGDYMGAPNVEGAVESGLWAARAITTIVN